MEPQDASGERTSNAETMLASVPHLAGDALAGRRIGAYEIVRLLGRGGMGAVYLCTRADDQFRQQVAIKILRPGIATDGLVRRFRAERQILASLNHPNLARLFDGGLTNEGEPYFVMEYVHGEALDTFLERGRAPVSQRLDVFRQVCDAVQAAHRALVVHRDLKPGNIMVTSEGVPKLLDFGIAKMLNPDPDADDLERTMTGMRLMTPEFASPEQVRGEAITTATDIYSLGVILYRLLAGTHPYALTSKSLVEMERAICEKDPEPLSRVTGQSIDPDLSAVVMKALRKEPAERYASVEQFSADIDRYRHGFPVLARRGTTGYQLMKFVRRNRMMAGAAAVLLVTLAAGVAATLWQASVARAERRQAVARFNDVRALANTFLFEFDAAIRDLPGAVNARRLVVSRALEYLDRLSSQAGNDVALRREIAEAYARVGTIQAQLAGPSLGNTDAALASQKKSLEIREALLTMAPASAAARRDLAASLHNMSDLLAKRSDTKTALATTLREQDIYRALAAEQPADRQRAIDLANTLIRLGDLRIVTGDLPAGRAAYEATLQAFETPPISSVDDAVRTRGLQLANEKLSEVMAQRGDVDGAIVFQQKSVELARSARDDRSPSASRQRDVAVALERLGDLHMLKANFKEAERAYLEEVELFERLRSADANDSIAKMGLGIAYEKAGNPLAELGKWTEARTYYEKSLKLAEEVSAADPSEAMNKRSLAISHMKVASAYNGIGRPAEAREHFMSYVQIMERVVQLDPSNQVFRRSLAVSYQKLSEFLVAQKEFPAALDAARRQSQAFEEIAAANPSNVQLKLDAATSYFAVATVAAEQNDNTSASEIMHKALALYEAIGKDRPDDTRVNDGLMAVHTLLGELLVDEKKCGEAVPHLKTAQTLLVRLLQKAPTHPRWLSAQKGIQQLLDSCKAH